ncbi:uroporphyrinogen-III synthase [Legionella micdadei]|uniref:Uroporphyrinogen-III synthase n=1 Tax=Legionella micdadei TaxID=451 RepID=A0A098GHX5_LEGMI|nr:uroporphyrinogen-III synthase [Legionella micdadei]ARG96547.1 uroporphyrinogen-III synthase [Legionella micdadei]ARG99295.1 uroporphyrinogen-III synthase [Legionella micdadei]KTD27383.1 uroporphyrinogen-III synthase [Legionella micdadei]CEG62093.1 Uroporphyrinogen III methylase [Legionella micdadei]SCY75131.1 uroporphyrinogen-III synthase [Legionella micdadei]
MNSLKGLRVLNTRPLTQGKSLSQAINAAGGIAIDCPALSIEPTDISWLKTLPDLHQVDKAIFISGNAVEYCFTALEKTQLLWPPTIQVIAVGQATAMALQQHQIEVSFVPQIANSEHLLELGVLQQIKHETILLFKGEDGRPLIADTLIARGANLLIFNVYKRLMPIANSEQIHSLWHNRAVDIILFTSQQAINNTFLLFGDDKQAWLRSIPCIVISERLAKEAALLGMQTIIISSPETILNKLHEFNQGLIDGQ